MRKEGLKCWYSQEFNDKVDIGKECIAYLARVSDRRVFGKYGIKTKSFDYERQGIMESHERQRSEATYNIKGVFFSFL